MSLATYFANFWEEEDWKKPEVSALKRMDFLASLVGKFLKKLLTRDAVKNNYIEL